MSSHPAQAVPDPLVRPEAARKTLTVDSLPTQGPRA
jgi:hypothetical protein